MSKRIVQLDGIRAIAIGAVFLHHSLGVRMLWMGVDLFFVLSGFLITGILMQQRTRSLGRYLGRFYRRRTQRILPPYVLLLVVTSFFFGISWMRHAYMYIFLMNMIKPLNIDQPGALSPLWSLAVEEQFYLFWPFAVYFFSESVVAWLAGMLMGLAPILRWTCTPMFASVWPIYQLTPFRMDCLACGALLALVWRRHQRLIERYGHYGLLVSVALMMLVAKLSWQGRYIVSDNTRWGNAMIYELTLMISLGLILWALSGRYVSVLTWKPIQYLGRISYSVYLVHMLMVLLMLPMIPNRRVLTVVAGAATLAFAMLSWHLLEKPILAMEPKEASVPVTA